MMNQRENEFEYTTPEEENWMDTVKDDMRGGELEEADGGRFRIHDTEQASWAFRKIKKANQELADLEAYAKREIEKIQTWLAKESEGHKSTVDYMEYLLMEYLQELRQEDPKAKISTPYGKVTTRRSQPSWQFDEEKTVNYLLQKAPELVEEVTSYKYNKTQVKKHFTLVETEDGLQLVDPDGELVELATVVQKPDAVSIKVED